MNRFEVSRRAFRDLQEIWEFISRDSPDQADGVLQDFYRAFAELANTPGLGHKREDLTSRAVLFWRVQSYLVIYRNTRPLRIVRVLHGKRDIVPLLNRS
jgi:toxin ParE1/3/4